MTRTNRGSPARRPLKVACRLSSGCTLPMTVSVRPPPTQLVKQSAPSDSASIRSSAPRSTPVLVRVPEDPAQHVSIPVAATTPRHRPHPHSLLPPCLPSLATASDQVALAGPVRRADVGTAAGLRARRAVAGQQARRLAQRRRRRGERRRCGGAAAESAVRPPDEPAAMWSVRAGREAQGQQRGRGSSRAGSPGPATSRHP